MSPDTKVFVLQHQLMDDQVIFRVFPESGTDWEGNLNPEFDYVLISPKQRGDLPVGPKGQWEECDECESDRCSARAIYKRLTADGYQLIR